MISYLTDDDTVEILDYDWGFPHIVKPPSSVSKRKRSVRKTIPNTFTPPNSPNNTVTQDITVFTKTEDTTPSTCTILTTAIVVSTFFTGIMYITLLTNL